MMRDTSHLLTTYSHCPMCTFTASGAFTLQEAWFSIVSFVKPQSNRHTELLTGNLKIKPRAAGECVTMLLTNFDLLCDLLLNRPTATWNLLVYKPAYCAGSKLNGFYRKSYIFPASWLAKALSSIAFFFLRDDFVSRLSVVINIHWCDFLWTVHRLALGGVTPL